MSTYSIKDLERLSGIKAHTIRIWEQRYDLVTPLRSKTNIRSYDDEQLKKLLIVSFLNKLGYKISKIAKLEKEEIVEILENHYKYPKEIETEIESFILSTISLDEVLFNQLYDRSIADRGFIATIEKLVVPFLIKLGFLWQGEKVSPAHEHFISNLIRQKLIAEVDKTPVSKKKGYDAILFLPDGEMHEIVLLYMHYLLKSVGVKVMYLGASVPVEDLKQLVSHYKPKFLFTVLTIWTSEGVTEYFESLDEMKSDAALVAYGRIISEINSLLPKGTVVLSELPEMNSFVEKSFG